MDSSISKEPVAGDPSSRAPNLQGLVGGERSRDREVAGPSAAGIVVGRQSKRPSLPPVRLSLRERLRRLVTAMLVIGALMVTGWVLAVLGGGYRMPQGSSGRVNQATSIIEPLIVLDPIVIEARPLSSPRD